MKGWKQTGSLIRFLIDSEGLGDTPNKQNAFCVYKCTACQVVNIELIVNWNLEKQGREEDVDHKNVCGLELRRLKRIVT